MGKGEPLSPRMELELGLCFFQGAVNHWLWGREHLALQGKPALSFGD